MKLSKFKVWMTSLVIALLAACSADMAPAPRPMTPSFATSPRPALTTPAPVTKHTIIEHRNTGGGFGGGGGGGGGGFLSSFAGGAAGSVIGNWLSGPSHHAAPAVMAGAGVVPMAAGVAGGGATVMAAPAGGTVVVQQGSSFPWGMLIFLALVGGFLWWFYKRRPSLQYAGDFQESSGFGFVRDIPEDPLHFFYTLQQAAMDGDKGKLQHLATPGMAYVLGRAPEPGRVALDSLKGVTLAFVESQDAVVYSFHDDHEKERVTETWYFSGGKLDGISQGTQGS